MSENAKYTCEFCGSKTEGDDGFIYCPYCGEPYDAEGYEPSHPMPCVRDEHGKIKEQNVKQLFTKINEELDELKEAVTILITFRDLYGDSQKLKKDDMCWIAEEAADTITAITTMLEALGIDVEMQNRRVKDGNSKMPRMW